MLFTLSHSFSHSDHNTFLTLITPNSVILLLQDGVNAAIKNSDAFLQLARTNCPIFALKADLEARGLTAFIADEVQIIDYAEFVTLTAKYYPQIAW